jgi:hypothetical protein
MVARHRPVSPRTRSSVASRLLMPVLFACLMLVGIAAYTVINGELRLPFGGGVLFAFQKDEHDAAQPMRGQVQPAGTVGVLACPRNLPAFTKITREHLLTRDGLHTVPVVEEAIESNGLFRSDVAGLQRLLGRVLRRGKPVNFAFTDSDFLPKGTRPGPSAGIPPGKRGMWIDTSTVPGLVAALAGDSIDLIAARLDKTAPAVNTSVLGNLTDPVMKARLETVASRGSDGPEARSWMIARGALVITPTRSRQITASGPQRQQPTIVDEVFLAMEPHEVALFSQALAQDVAILAVPRSGQPVATPTEIEDSKPVDVAAEMRRMLTGEAATEPVFGMVEVIRGGERQSVTVPRAKQEAGGR